MIMYVILKGTPRVAIIATYCPTALATDDEKNRFYSHLSRLYRKPSSRAAVITLGDFNAKIWRRASPDETPIGPHLFDPNNNDLTQQSAEVATNRQNLINFCIEQDLIMVNTQFQKPDYKLCTYKRATDTPVGPPRQRHAYNTTEYALVADRWKNACKDSESNPYANVTSDNFPILSRFSFKLKAGQPTTYSRPKYSTQTMTSMKSFQDAITQQQLPLTNITIKEDLNTLAQQHLLKTTPKDKPPHTSTDLNTLIERRHLGLEQGNAQEAHDLWRQAQKQRRKGKRQNAEELVQHDMDIRDRWLGIKALKSDYNPLTYSNRTATQTHIPKAQRQSAAATYLANIQWVNPPPPPSLLPEPITDEHPILPTSPFLIQELQAIIKKMHNRKTHGPDEIPNEAYKSMNHSQHEQLLDLINSWWLSGSIPQSEPLARVVLMYKKGDSSQFANYRPVSLLNCTYKLYAALIKQGLADGTDHLINSTQFGSRRIRSTTDALQYARIIIDIGESTPQPVHLLLQDWEKAFDAIPHDRLMHSLQRSSINDHYIQAIKPLYTNPQFFVEIEGDKSEYQTQSTGIRQGYPLSPYLFLLVMTCLFHDVKQQIQLSTKPRIPTVAHDEIMFADDTVLITKTAATMQA